MVLLRHSARSRSRGCWKSFIDGVPSAERIQEGAEADLIGNDSPILIGANAEEATFKGHQQLHISHGTQYTEAFEPSTTLSATKDSLGIWNFGDVSNSVVKNPHQKQHYVVIDGPIFHEHSPCVTRAHTTLQSCLNQSSISGSLVSGSPFKMAHIAGPKTADDATTQSIPRFAPSSPLNSPYFQNYGNARFAGESWLSDHSDTGSAIAFRCVEAWQPQDGPALGSRVLLKLSMRTHHRIR